MRMPRTLVTMALAGVLAVTACEGASSEQGGNPDQQGVGQAPERGQGTIANDTAPARPGVPTPQEVPTVQGTQAEQKEGETQP
jgi:hypothetical protein